jgi:hypothetical protein
MEFIVLLACMLILFLGLLVVVTKSSATSFSDDNAMLCGFRVEEIN